MNVIHVLFVLCFPLSSSLLLRYPINNTKQFIQVLSTISDGNDEVIIELDSSVIYKLSWHGRKFLQISNISSLTIQSDSQATIYCNNEQHGSPSQALSFYNIKELVLKNLMFITCGANLAHFNQNTLHYINTSQFYFSNNHSAALVFTSIQSLTVQQVNISGYYGFAIISYNIPHSVFTKIVIENVTHEYSIGCGVLLLYSTKLEANAVIQNSTFRNNAYRMYKVEKCIYDIFLNDDNERFSITGATGLTIIYSNSSLTNVTINNTDFHNNSGIVAGAISIQQIDSSTCQTVIGSGVKFYKNSMKHCKYGSDISHFFKPCYSISGISTHTLTPLKVVDSKFVGQSISSGSIYIYTYSHHVHVLFFLQRLDFNDYQATSTGFCLYAASENPIASTTVTNINVTFVLEDITATNNSQVHAHSRLAQAAAFSFLNIKNVIIRGSCTFGSNFGSAITLINSVAKLHDVLVFINNSGHSGSAIKLLDNGYLSLSDGLRAKFIGNNALTYGGAIYASSARYLEHLCTFQVNSPHKPTSNNISIIFMNNKAMQAGSSIYSTNVYHCRMHDQYQLLDKDVLTKIYDVVFLFQKNSSKQQHISTVPSHLQQCSKNDTAIVGYPGKTVVLSLAAFDVMNKSVFSLVSVDMQVNDKQSESWHILKHDKEQVIDESANLTINQASAISCKNCCSTINVTLKSDKAMTEQNVSGALLFSFSFNSPVFHVPIELRKCPMGFKLDPNHDKQKCTCSPAVKNFSKSRGIDHTYKPECDIQSGTILRVGHDITWAGVIEVPHHRKMVSAFAISRTCHKYCNLPQGYHYLAIDDQRNKTYITNDKNDKFNTPLCLANRKGPLCSSCVEGTSVVFGSTVCKKCSSLWLLTIVLYIALGPLLIYLMSSLKLTLTSGTLNGIIFFAQMAALGKNDTYRYGESNSKFFDAFASIATWCISVLNLSIGGPICFYATMDEFVKMCIHLLFPMYLLTIVVFLIVASHFSVSLSNRISPWSVQVLVTIIHLSITRIFKTTSDVFASIELYVDIDGHDTIKRHVWYGDGTIEYGTGKHLGLMVTTLLVAGVLILPYITISVGGRYLMRYRQFNKYLRPLHEAIHAPYKDKKQHWFEARLFLVLLAYSIHTYIRSSNVQLEYLILGTLSALFTILQAWSKPFKSKVINMLDLFVMIWFDLSLVMSVYFQIKKSLLLNAELAVVFVMVVFSIFLIIVVHNMLSVTGQLEKVKDKVNQIIAVIHVYRCCRTKRNRLHITYSDEEASADDCHDYREPLLSPASSHSVFINSQ